VDPPVAEPPDVELLLVDPDDPDVPDDESPPDGGAAAGVTDEPDDADEPEGRLSVL